MAFSSLACSGGAQSLGPTAAGDAATTDIPSLETPAGPEVDFDAAPLCGQGNWSQPEYESLKYGGAWRSGDIQTTLLLDGRVILGSGYAIFDPRTSTYARFSYSESRELARLSVLADGRVLMTGGGYGDASSTDAFLLDPNALTMTRVAPMLASRASHVQLTLRDGRVLVVGGVGPEGFAPTVGAEVYDPVLDRWSALSGAPSAFQYNGSGDVGWAEEIGVLLNDGSALIVGDVNVRYDAEKDIWTPVEVPFSFPIQFAYALPDGRIFVIGPSEPGRAPIPHGHSAIWNALTGDHSEEALIPEWVDRYGQRVLMITPQAAALPCGEILVAAMDADYRMHTLFFDPTRNFWRESMAKLPDYTEMHFSATPLADGRMLVFPTARANPDRSVGIFRGPALFSTSDPTDVDAGTADRWR